MNTAQLKLQQSIEIKVQPRYLPEQSNEELAEYTFAYTVRIANNSEQSVQLLARHWIITDGNNTIREVEGEGVVGQQPDILQERLTATAVAQYFQRKRAPWKAVIKCAVLKAWISMPLLNRLVWFTLIHFNNIRPC